jgi:hypothetical protein
VLDTLCDAVLNPDASGPGSHARGNFDLSTAGGIADALREFVGDPTGLADAEAAAVRRREAGQPMSQPSWTGTLPVVPIVATPTPETETFLPPEPEQEPEAEPEPPEAPAARQDQPTQAGIPIFDDDGDVSWVTKRAEKPPPPPPFDDIPARPLFAPEPVDGSPARRARPSVAAAGNGPGPGPGGYWPWDSSTGTGAPITTTGSGIIEAVDEDDHLDERPGRSWLWLAALVAALTLVLLAVAVAFNVGRGKTPLGGEPESERSTKPSPSRTAAAGLTAYTGITAQDFDPQGEDLQEFPELAALAVDGDPATAWRTQTYLQQLGPAGLKTGVGLTLDLGAGGEVGEVDLTLGGQPTGVSVYVTDTAPRGVRGLTPVATATVEGTEGEIVLDQPATGRYVTVWLTALPPVDGGFRSEVAEVAVLGTPAA